MTARGLDAEGHGSGGWPATASQGLLLARWIAAELVAQRVAGFALVAWIVAGLGIVALGASIPVDPGWPLVVLAVGALVIAAAGRLVIAATVFVLRRLALPRRARHLRPEAAAARARLRGGLADAGVPVSISAAARFVWALARGRRPHAGVAGNLRGLSGRLAEVAEIDRLRVLLAEAAPAPAWLTRDDDRPDPSLKR